MILSDREIEAALELQQIKIEPRPDKSLWISTAIDLTLDGVLLKWKRPEAKPSGEKAGPRKIYPSSRPRGRAQGKDRLLTPFPTP